MDTKISAEGPESWRERIYKQTFSEDTKGDAWGRNNRDKYTGRTHTYGNSYPAQICGERGNWKELDRRGLSYARWADDFVILLKSKRSAHRVMERITRYLEETLGLPVNREKSEVALMREVTFLGFRIYRLKIRVSDQSIAKFKRRIHELTHRNNPKSMQTIIEELNRFLRGWANYFRIQEFKTLFGNLDDWVRGRLRSMQLAKWKKPKKFQRAMINAGVPVWRARRLWVAMRSWQSANRREVLRVLNADWFRSLGLIFLHDYSAASTS